MYSSKNLIRFLAVLLVVGLVRSDIAFNNDTQINSYYKGDQQKVKVATLMGGYLAYWESNNGIYAKIYDNGNNPVGNDFQLNDPALGAVFAAHVCGLSNGGFAATYQKYVAGLKWRNFLRVFDSTGKNVVPTPTPANPAAAAPGTLYVSSHGTDNTYPDESMAKLAALPNNQFIATWHSNTNAPLIIVARIFNGNDGTEVKPTFQVSQNSPVDQNFPRIAASGNYIAISWQNGPQGNTAYSAAILLNDPNSNSAPTPTCPQIEVGSGITVTSDDGILGTATPAIILNNNPAQNIYIFVWEDDTSKNGVPTIYLKRFRNDGTQDAEMIQVNTYSGSPGQQQPSIAVLPNLDYVVVWQSYGQDGWGYGIYGQRYTYTGVAEGNEFLINTYTQGDQKYPSVAASMSSLNFIVAWQSYGQDQSGWGVFATALNDCYSSVYIQTFLSGSTASNVNCGQCPVGTYAPSNSFKCSATCSSVCSACLGTATTCTACSGANYLLNSQCVPSCGSGYYVSNNVCAPCSSTCKTCSGTSSNTCTACSGSRYLSGTSCVQTCPPGTYADSATQTCRACDSSCATCSSGDSASCSTCTNSFLLGSVCVATCPEGQYGNTGSNACAACDSSCLTCNGVATTACTACGSNTFLTASGTCSATCSGSTYADTTTNTCKACEGTCATCSSSDSGSCKSCSTGFLYNSRCVAACPAGFYGSSNQCMACDKTCATCNGPSTSACTSCSGNAFLAGNPGTCGACPSNTYKDAASNTCKACEGTCATCSSSDSKSCLSCTTGFLLNSQCVSACPASFYGASNQCMACDKSCATCNGPSTSACTSCSGNAFLAANPGTCGTCPSNTFQNTETNTCDSCDASCGTCSSGDSRSCLTCTTGFLFNTHCVAVCPAGFYGASNKCLPCDKTCATCTAASATSCTSCSGNGFLNSVTGACGPCPSNKFQNTETNTCDSCDASCGTCSSGDSGSCLSCTTGFLSNSFCVAACPSGSYGSSNKCSLCHQSCGTCTNSGQTDCSSCTGNTFLSATTGSKVCTSTCPTGTYEDADTNVCQACEASCGTCSSGDSASCLSCTTGFLLNSQCVSSCPAGYYGSQNECLPCHNTCTTCSDGSACTSCGGNSYLSGTQCSAVGCGDGKYAGLLPNLCRICDSTCETCATGDSTACTQCSGQRYLLGTECVTDCGPGYYADQATQKCLACDSGCTTCSGAATSCTSCFGYQYLLNSECLTECGQGKFGNAKTNTCEACSGSCDTCSDQANSCTSCTGSLYLLKSACLADCGQGFYSDITTNKCLTCDSTCGTCSGGATQCTSCSGALYLLGSSCVSECGSGYTQNTSNNKCQAVHNKSMRNIIIITITTILGTLVLGAIIALIVHFSKAAQRKRKYMDNSKMKNIVSATPTSGVRTAL